MSRDPQHFSLRRLRVLQEMIIGLKLHRKNIPCSKLNAIFKVVKMNFGSKFGAWVPFYIFDKKRVGAFCDTVDLFNRCEYSIPLSYSP